MHFVTTIRALENGSRISHVKCMLFLVEKNLHQLGVVLSCVEDEPHRHHVGRCPQATELTRHLAKLFGLAKSEPE